MTEMELIEQVRQIRSDYPEQAIEALRKGLREHPDSTRLRLLLASIYVDEHGDGPAGAERIYREVLRREPNNPRALTGLALLHGYPGATVQVDESLSLLKRAVQHSPDISIAQNLAYKAWDTGRFELAKEAFERVLYMAEQRKQSHRIVLARQALDAIKRNERPESVYFEGPE